MLQIDHNDRERFNLTSDEELNSIESLVLGKVHGKCPALSFQQPALTSLASRCNNLLDLCVIEESYMLKHTLC